MAKRSITFYLPIGRTDMEEILDVCVTNAPKRKVTEYLFNRLLLFYKIHPEAFGESLMPVLEGKDSIMDAKSFVRQLRADKDLIRQLSEILSGDLQEAPRKGGASPLRASSLEDQIKMEEVLAEKAEGPEKSKKKMIENLNSMWDNTDDE